MRWILSTEGSSDTASMDAPFDAVITRDVFSLSIAPYRPFLSRRLWSQTNPIQAQPTSAPATARQGRARSCWQRLPVDPLSESSSASSAPPGDPSLDHPIFRQSIRLIREALEPTGVYARWPDALERDVLERLVHSSGDLSLPADLVITPGACRAGMVALAAGAPILTDTAMAAAAVAPMARRTFDNPVHSVLRWAPDQAPAGGTRAAAGMERALREHPGAVVLIGSAPTALEVLLDLSVAQAGTPLDAQTATSPALVIGMPVGFVGVAESKRRLAASALPQIRLDGSRGGAGLVGAAVNALLRRAWLERSLL